MLCFLFFVFSRYNSPVHSQDIMQKVKMWIDCLNGGIGSSSSPDPLSRSWEREEHGDTGTGSKDLPTEEETAWAPGKHCSSGPHLL